MRITDKMRLDWIFESKGQKAVAWVQCFSKGTISRQAIDAAIRAEAKSKGRKPCKTP